MTAGDGDRSTSDLPGPGTDLPGPGTSKSLDDLPGPGTSKSLDERKDFGREAPSGEEADRCRGIEFLSARGFR